MSFLKSLIFYLIFSFTTFSIFHLKSLHQISKQEKENPGWIEQFNAMKNLKFGDNYYGLRNSWAKWDRLNKKSNNVLSYVKELGTDKIGGRVRALLIDASDSSHLLAGAVSGGLWESLNGGNSWIPVSDQNISLAVTCITQNPFNPKEIYYGTGEALGNSAAIDGAGVFKSIDGGKTFTQLTSTTLIGSFATIWDIEFSKTDSSTFYVGTRSGGLYRTKNNGLSFQLVFSTSVDVHEILTYKDSTVWGAIYGYGMITAKEENNMKFSLIKDILPTSGIGRISMSYCESFPQVAFCQIMNTGSTALVGNYKTSNHGKTWKKVNSSILTGVYSWAWYCLNTQISPMDTNFVLCLSVKSIFSRDGGNSWQELKTSHADFHTTAFFASGNNFLIGNDGGVYRFNKSSAVSSNLCLNNGLHITQFYTGALNRNNPNVFMGGAQDNHTNYYNGKSYTEVYGGDGSYCGFSSTAPYYHYVSSQNGEIRRFANDFSGLKNIKPSGTYNYWFINPFELNPLNGNQLFFLTKNKILVSNNAGDNWSDLSNALNKTVLSIGVSREINPTVYFGGGGSALYRANNAGTLTKIEKDLTSTSPANAKGSVIAEIKVNYTNPSTIYLAMSDISSKPRIWKVNNAKTDSCKWIDISGDLPTALPVNCIEVNPQDSNVMLAGTDFGLYSTLNGGKNWVKELAVPNVVIFKIGSHPRDGIIYIFTHGRGVYKSQFTNFIANIKPLEKSKNPYLISFNNPTDQVLKIKTNLKDLNKMAMVCIYNLLGEMLMSNAIDSMTEIDVSNLAKGTYILSVIIDNNAYSYRMLKR